MTDKNSFLCKLIGGNIVKLFRCNNNQHTSGYYLHIYYDANVNAGSVSASKTKILYIKIVIVRERWSGLSKVRRTRARACLIELLYNNYYYYY